MLGAMTITHRPHDIEADITFLAIEAGGKTNSVRSCYRPSRDFHLDGMLNDAHHEYIGCESVAPGETARAKLWLLAPDYHVGRFYPGFQLTVQEGTHVAAHGIIVDVIDPALRCSA
jgi:translation elongation factor EF-Tu-like GTPase